MPNMCPPADNLPVNGDEEMVQVDLADAVKVDNHALQHGTKKGFYARPSDFLSNTSNWKVGLFRRVIDAE